MSDDWFQKYVDLNQALIDIRNEIIEECARVAYEHRPDKYSLYDRTDFAAAIRSLKGGT